MPRPAPLTPAFLRRALGTAERAVRAIAPWVAGQQARLRRGQVRRKGVGDFVTDVDVRAERRLRRLLQAGLPGSGFLGEETPSDPGDGEFVWVVDPIDGTSNYANGLPQFAVAVALMRGGEPVVAAIWCAPEDAVYTAAKGRGARREGRRLRMRPGRCDDAAIFGAQWHRGAAELAFLRALQRPGGRIRTFGCTVVQLADVVQGRLDANVQQQGRLWDFAAAGLVVLEAGGRFTDWQGAPVFPFRGRPEDHTATVAAAPNVHRKVLRLLHGVPLVVPAS